MALPAPALAVVEPESVLIGRGEVWSYLDDGVPQGVEWRDVGFDDSEWPTGRGEFGYGDGDETTVVGFGQDPNFKHVTTYFRRVIDVDKTALRRTTLRLLADDGAVVYVNGVTVFRWNMPAGEIDWGTLALSALADPSTNPSPGRSEVEFVQFGLWAGYFVPGTNVVAVEVHQASRSTDDCSFDLELWANRPLGPPSIEILSPADGSVVLDTELEFRVEASDYDGHIYRVDYFADDEKVGESTAFPFTFNWYPVPAGRHRLQALAIDYSGRRGFSEVVRVQVGEVVGDRLLRGPYLQMGATDGVVICWRTDWLTPSVVRYGPNPFELSNEAVDCALTTEHAVRLRGLHPGTRYYYSVGTIETLLASGAEFYFSTAPAVPKATRIWAIGDSGTADENAEFVRNVYEHYTESQPADLWLMLGDNAYEEGTDGQYQAAVFDMYPALLRNTVLWPTIGNHDASLADPSGRLAYHDIFELPQDGEAGGVASGTENYYSFDFSNIHFICLDSALSDRSKGGAMVTWLEQDLAETAKEWIIAFWHHPPYTFGTHDSDRELDLIEMRENVLPVLESYGVDLVLGGHSHAYERSFLLNGHYGYSTNLAPSMILNFSSGQVEDDGPYEKPAGGLGAGRGTVYAVCGCSGEGGFFTVREHPAMFTSQSGYGSLVIDVEGSRLDLKFLNQYLSLGDWFTIEKGAPGPGVRPRLKIRRGEGVSRISWPTSLMPYVLERAERPGAKWLPWADVPLQVGREHRVTVDQDKGQELFRLRANP